MASAVVELHSNFNSNDLAESVHSRDLVNGSCKGHKRALLVGIRLCKSKEYAELPTAHEDVYKMRELLIDVYEYTPSEITVIVDDGVKGHLQPTRHNILAAIAELVNGVKKGDHLCFHYAGHSSQIPNERSNSEEDGMNECLVPLDGEEMMIVDDELHNALVRPLPAGAHLVAVMDTSHSGSLLDLDHFLCNRVYVPWVWRGWRHSEELRSEVVRRGARLPTILQATSRAFKTLPFLSNRDLHATGDGPASPSSQKYTGSSSHRTPSLMRLRHGKNRPLARTRTLTLALRSTIDKQEPRIPLVPPTAAHAFFLPDEPQTRENGDADLCMSAWILPEEMRCESPEIYSCNGWCRDRDPASADETGQAHVMLLASCRKSQMAWERIAWEANGVSMTLWLVQLLRENPNRSLADLIVSISHATYALAAKRGREVSQHRLDLKKRTELFLQRWVGVGSLASHASKLLPSPISLSTSPRESVDESTNLAFLSRVAKRLAAVKQKLVRQDVGYDMANFQIPELASTKPLDMTQPWSM